MKKTLALLLSLAMILALAACGGTVSDPNAGLYDAVSAEMWGISVEVKEVFEDGFSIELLNGGKAKFNYDGKSYNMKWTLDGDAFHAEGGGAELDGTLSNGVMVLEDVLDSGVTITLVCAALSVAGTGAEAEKTGIEKSDVEKGGVEKSETDNTAPARSYDWWSGRWYGWRVLYSGTGEYAQYKDKAWDVLADIKVNGDKGSIVLWDYEESVSDQFFDVELSFTDDGDRGHATAVGGTAYDIDAVDSELSFDYNSPYAPGVENMLIIEGHFVDPDNSEDTMDYFFILRPWGMEWEDLRGVENDDFLYADMMPLFYDDWYLPEIGVSPKTQTGEDNWWSGDWYGWRAIYAVDGTEYQEDVNNAWDVCATFEVNGDTGTLYLWDYEESIDEAAMVLKLRFTPDGDDPELVTVTGGNYYGNDALDCGIEILSDDPYTGGISNMISIYAEAYDSDAPDEVAYLVYFLRPWGTLWDDVDGVDYEESLYADMMPTNYSWYLEQLN